MKPRRLSSAKLTYPLAASIAALLSASPLSAAAFFWDTNSTTAGFGTANGTWGSDAFWTTDATGAFGVAGITGPATTDTTNFGNAGTGLATGTIAVNGTVNSGSMTFASGSGNITLSGGNINFGTSTTIRTGIPTSTATIASNITAATTNFTKAGSGTLVLSGANSYAAATRISGGGTLVLDYGSGNDSSKLADGALLSLLSGGGNIILKGGSHNEAVTNFTIGVSGGNTIGGHTHISRDGGSSTLTLGTLTRAQTLGSTVSFAEDGLATTTTLVQRGMLGGGVTVGSNWAKTDVGGSIIALAGADYTALPTGGLTSTANYQLTGAQNHTGSANANSLRIVGDGVSDQTLNLNANNLLLGTVALGTVGNSGGLLYAGGGTNNYTITGSGNIQGQNGNQELIINTFTGTLTLDLSLTPGNGNGGSAGMSKSGAGTLVLTKAGTYTGQTLVNQGALRIKHSDSLGTNVATAKIVVHNGGALELDNGVAIGNLKATTLTGYGVADGGALRNLASNTSSYAAAITISSGGARINSDAGGSLTLTGGVVIGSIADVIFGGAGNTTVSTTAISGASGRVIKDGTGTLTLSAANTYTGATTVSAGTLLVNGSTSSTSLVTVGAAGTLGGTGTVAGAMTVAGTLSPGSSPGILATGNETWLNGGDYNFQMLNAVGAAGTGFDQIAVTGTLDLTNLTAGGFAINLWSLSSITPDVNGNALNFNNALTQSWAILTASTAINGFDAADFQVNVGANNGAGGFSNALGGGSFSVSADANNLFLNFTAVPEPNVAALIGAFGGILLLRRRR